MNRRCELVVVAAMALWAGCLTGSGTDEDKGREGAVSIPALPRSNGVVRWEYRTGFAGTMIDGLDSSETSVARFTFYQSFETAAAGVTVSRLVLTSYIPDFGVLVMLVPLSALGDGTSLPALSNVPEDWVRTNTLTRRAADNYLAFTSDLLAYRSSGGVSLGEGSGGDPESNLINVAAVVDSVTLPDTVADGSSENLPPPEDVPPTS